jgi:cell division septation protein DedD
LKGSPQFPIDVLNNKVPDIAAKQAMVSKALEMLQLKMGGNVASEPIVVAEWPKIEAAHESMSVKEPHVQEISPIKPEVEHEQLATKKAVAHEQTPTKEVVGHEHAPTKESVVHDTIPAPHETATTKVKAQSEEIKANPEVAKAKPEVVKVKPITPEKVVVKKGPVKEKIQEIPGKWGVNLVAFKQEWFAKSKAAEFAQQGIYAEVIPVHEKNTTMYRLRVGGFRSKKEAYSNTDRIKKLLNLDSVWVSDN